MNRLFSLGCLSLLFTFVGCGGVAEEAPPTEAPEMSAEETQDMNDQMEMMKKMQESGGTESK
ncbi:MAG: hypothetical protein P8K08_08500 [Fuerstiella sp.]|jgi:hypothetical protein|nr:hypothetical protein [Fuerstiella sp.]